jgi:hypothetical protein
MKARTGSSFTVLTEERQAAAVADMPAEASPGFYKEMMK